MKRLIVMAWLLFAAPAGRIDLSLPDINGKVHTLPQYAGKWVIVN